jgi:cell division protein FtsI (penicillin-binding protein 3)
LLIGPKPITDTHPHGMLTVSQVIQKSSNIGTAKLALQLEPREMWDLFAAVGFGQAPNIGFPGAVAGRLHPHQKWGQSDQARMSFGYGISTSLFQLARAYTIFARDGELVPTTILRNPEYKPGTRVMSAKTAIEMRNMLETVTEQGGTAIRARADGFRIKLKARDMSQINTVHFLWALHPSAHHVLLLQLWSTSLQLEGIMAARSPPQFFQPS